MSVGERICELRATQNLSQGQLAEAMGVTRQAVSKWERAESSPDTDNLILLPEFGKMLWFGVLRLGNFGAQEVFDIFLFQIKIVKL